VRYEYDALGQMTRQVSHEGAVTTYAYDPAGRWAAVTNGESSDTVRTVRGATPSVDQVTVRNGARYVLNTRRDTVSNFSRVTTSWGYGVTHYYLNDHSGRLRELRDDAVGLATQIVRNETNNTTAYVLPSGDSIIHGPTETRYTDPSASTALGRAYWYDALQRVQQRGPSVFLKDVLGYDGRGQLSDVYRYDYNAGGYTSLTQYTYDGAGNPTHSGASVSTGNRLDTFDGYTLTYDADGNLIRKYKPQACTDWYYGYNSLGQLVDVQGTSNCGNPWYVITYGYDGMGRRVRKTDRGVTTRYLYDGQHVVAELDAAGNLARQYTWYEGVDRPHSMRTGGQTYYYVSDKQGNVTGLVNSTGALVNRYEYTVFGAPVVVSEGVANPLRFAGGYMDLESGLYNNRARFYDAALQRFISEDPVGLAGGLNPYSYAGNDPVNASDPTGLSPCPSWEVMIDGKCQQQSPILLDPICTCDAPTLSDWLRGWLHARREFIISPADEAAYMAALDEEAERRQMEAARAEAIDAAVRSAREAADLGVGFVPGASTVHDATVVLTGRNVITGERVGWGGRSIALIGVVTPIAGSHLRVVGHIGDDLIRKGLKYQDRVEKAGLDLYHSFPRILDTEIIRNGAWSQRIKDAAHWFEMPGDIGGTPGRYQIGINADNEVFHRNFVPW
jgi:RHS repeat-associated protein